MPKGLPVFVVEGHLEHKFLAETSNGKIRILKLSNGKQVSPAALAKQVHAQVRAAQGQPPYVIVIADREKRKQSALQLEADITSELTKLSFPGRFHVHVPDMMIENWILADAGALAKEGLNPNVANGTEGCHGKGKLSEAFRNRNKNYKETIDGVRLLKSCSAIAIRQKSPSFRRLFRTISRLAPGCYWLKR